MTVGRVSLIAGAISAGVLTMAVVAASGGSPGRGTAQTATATAVVVRTTLASREQVTGTLDQARSYTLVSQQTASTLTEMAAPGTVVSRGQVLYRLDGTPIRLLYGTQAPWRTLALGISDGADVLQLKQNLKAIGFTADGALAVNDDFDWATAIAIEQWQRAQGVAQTGVIPLGTIAFLPGPVRVTGQLALPGSLSEPGTPVLDLSSIDLAVNVPLDPSLRQLVHARDRVQIQLPEGQTTPGRVIDVGAANTAASAQATPQGSDSASAGAVQGSSGSATPSGGRPAAAVPVLISLDRPRDARGLDQVPVQVAITDAIHRNVLAVPITSLLALAGGGYAVAIDQAGTRTLIPVRAGIFNGDLVEVSSSRLQPGMRVEVPSS